MENTNTPTIAEQHDDLTGAGISPTPSCSFQSTEHAALAYSAAGLSVIPLKADKSPAVDTWTELKSRVASEAEITPWYTPTLSGVGIICGAVSGNIECLDIDEKYNLDVHPLLEQIIPIIDLQASGLLSHLVHETSVHAGHHFIYRCSTISGSMKLARREPTEGELNRDPKLKSMVLIETRGEGGYFACYPTPGYTLVSGSFLTIPEITPEERDILLESARALNRYTREERLITRQDG